MEGILFYYKKLIKFFGFIEKTFGIVLLISIVVIMNAQVFMRYIIRNPIIWAEEYLIYAFIVGVFIGASYGYKEKRHTAVMTFIELLPEKGKYYYVIIKSILVVFACIFLFIGALTAFRIEAAQTSITLPITLPRYVTFSGPVLYCTISISITAIYDILELIFQSRKNLQDKLYEQTM